ncbi:MAG: bacterial Ig-like domain-containing protein [Bacilli bacterium]|jgi:hypothetical protein|nr:bacterial Ig-like domain-containing protein [Bacilli bacterium]MCH4228183.1 bacterial Ig-like domain-containing protein [Bacilli bacterium]MCH4277463.1 bacterial Ig-like domain-containing protein [Bacilli bacterium]
MFGTRKKESSGNLRLAVSAFVLILSICAMGVVTFSWFSTTNSAVNQMTLTSGASAVTVDVYAYKQGYSSDDNGNPVPAAFSIQKSDGVETSNATKGDADSTGEFTVTFDSDTLSTFSYEALYGDELYMDDDQFPHLYVELRYTKATLSGFVKSTISNLSYASDITGYTNLSTASDGLKYQYRFITLQNTANNTMYTNGLKAAYSDSTYVASSWTTFDPSSSMEIYNNTTDLDGYQGDTTQNYANQCYVPGFPYKSSSDSYYYSKSTMMEFRIDPLDLVEYFRTHKDANNTLMNFGVSFDVRLDFSNTPYKSSDTSPKVVLSSSSMNMKTNSSSSSVTLNTGYFSSTPTYSVTSSDSSIATATTSVNSGAGLLNINTYDTTGTATITVTATNGSETASSRLKINVYSGPTIILSENSVTLNRGNAAAVVVSNALFSSTPSYSATSSDSSIATASISGSNVIINGINGGTVDVVVTGVYGTETASATLSVTVSSAVRSLQSISISTLPNTTTYSTGSTFSTKGLVVIGNYNLDPLTIEITDYSISPADGTTLQTAGTITVTVTYQGFTATFDITVS